MTDALINIWIERSDTANPKSAIRNPELMDLDNELCLLV